MKGILPYIIQYQIELEMIAIPPTHIQAMHQMNLNYVVVVKQHLDKLLAIRFIERVDQIT